MKKILLLASIASLFSTTGCLVADGGRRDHARIERHDEVIVRPVEVRPPEVVVRPPEIIVR